MHSFIPVKFKTLTAVILLFIVFKAGAQTELEQSSDSLVNKKRLNTVLISGGALYATGMYGFYQLWYKDFETTSFHLFNDNSEWLLMDKFGHVGTSYQFGKWGQKVFLWTGLPKQKATWYGIGVSTLFQTSIEVFDGFSSEWGFSVGDVVANTAGSAMFLSQELLWQEQRITFKFSYHQTGFPKYRPSLLGDNEIEKVFKDYNGQTYWLSANIKSFAFKQSNIPNWLNIGIGYGARGMVTAKEDDPIAQELMLPDFERYSRFFLSPDISLTKIQSKSKVVNTLLDVFEFVKIPLPTLEVNSKGDIKFHPLYF